MTDGHIKQLTESFSQAPGIQAEFKPEKRDALSETLKTVIWKGDGVKNEMFRSLKCCGTDP